jgi:uncharacterized Tic20 family protein
MSSESQIAAGSAPPTQEERGWAMGAHLCGLLWLLLGGSWLVPLLGMPMLFTVLGPFIIWKAKGDTLPFVASQAKESLNFQITVLLIALVGWMLAWIGIGFLILWALGIINTILVIIAAIQVNDGKPYRYPFAVRLVQ